METEKKTETENLFIQTCPTTDYGSDYKQKCSVLEPLARRRSFVFVQQCYDSFLHNIYQSSQWETIIMANLIKLL